MEAMHADIDLLYVSGWRIAYAVITQAHLHLQLITIIPCVGVSTHDNETLQYNRA